MESIQYNAALAITSAVRGTCRKKYFQELGFEPLQQRRWYKKICCFSKIINNESPRKIPNSLHKNQEISPNFVQKIHDFFNTKIPDVCVCVFVCVCVCVWGGGDQIDPPPVVFREMYLLKRG